ncbi:hypothetical protein [Nitriliruptor alkaliphilus]|uniref:hypothetical protein n=1 Tax=Nitriliruptor alkaliphilus TaxID=427918 RepID=UPI0012EE90FE|nr:hypothetical protein [Nitriliruptor alkaliphilus]
MINNFAKRIRRLAFGITNWAHWRVRILLYAGKPDWSKLATITPHGESGLVATASW